MQCTLLKGSRLGQWSVTYNIASRHCHFFLQEAYQVILYLVILACDIHLHLDVGAVRRRRHKQRAMLTLRLRPWRPVRSCKLSVHQHLSRPSTPQGLRAGLLLLPRAMQKKPRPLSILNAWMAASSTMRRKVCKELCSSSKSLRFFAEVL